ncbi:tyrosine-type recombinase/integrase [Pectinatus frisingensis]|uniref:tyrosine-type recombinase/integrase n=1 Tax=Pectinatus frisingensis TaxID=865 RepID=UPI0018C5475D|nr:tyrosine-type recombinase/integrase [Pectinatus frisingensis]
MPAKVRKRSNGTYQLAVSYGSKDDGSQMTHYKTITAATKVEAVKAWVLFASEVQKGQVIESKKSMNLDDFFHIWTSEFALAAHSIRTQETNIYLYRRISKALGHKKLKSITPLDIQKFYNNLKKVGIKQDPNSKTRKCSKQYKKEDKLLSPTTVRKYHVLLHELFAKAVKWQMVIDNPVDRVEAPKTPPKLKKTYSDELINKFVNGFYSEDLKHKILGFIALVTGARRGEIMGLQWRHIDIEQMTVTIEQTNQYIRGEGTKIIKATKNASSLRKISLPKYLCELLKEYKQNSLLLSEELGDIWQGAHDIDDIFVFSNYNGLPMEPGSFNHWLTKYCKKNNIDQMHPHELRHIATSIWIKNNVPLQTISSRLGHANTVTTQIIYSHLIKNSDKQCSDIFDEMLGNNKNR